MPPLLAVAHGSRDPRSAATVWRLLDQVRAQAPGFAVRGAFLDLNAPTVPEMLAALHAEGHRAVTVVPLLLGSAYHARVDLPALVDEATSRAPGLDVTVSDVLGPDPLLQELALARAATTLDAASPHSQSVSHHVGAGPRRTERGVQHRRRTERHVQADIRRPDPIRLDASRHDASRHDASRHDASRHDASRHEVSRRGVVLAGVGSSDAAANATVAQIAARWQARGEFTAVAHAFATCEPSVAAAIRSVRAQGATQVAFTPWFLAPGLLLDRVAAQARTVDSGALVAEPLGAHAAVADVVLARYAAAAALADAA